MSSVPASPPQLQTPAWIPRVLMAAAVYNLLWGTVVVLFPILPFGIADIPAPNYPSVVRCLGMVIGVYGIGYAMAARDPVTQWPLVFVGLLGKVFGPIGFVFAATTGEFPWRCGVMILANDLIWWVPFTAIILHALRVQDAQHHPSNQTLPDVLQQTRTQTGANLYELSQQQPLLVVCVRHSGCTYCREALADLARHRNEFQHQGVRPVIVHMGTIAQGERMLQSYHCQDFDQVSDPERQVYRALELRLGTLSELFGIKAFWRALGEGTVFRFGFGPMVGNGLQMPGAFLIRNGQIVKAYRHTFSGDRPDYAQIACPI